MNNLLRERANKHPEVGCSKYGGGATMSTKNGGSVDELDTCFFIFWGVEMTLHYFGRSVDDQPQKWGECI